MRKIILILLIIPIGLPINLYAGPTWTVKVRYPDKEVKTYEFSDKKSDLSLGKFGWKCEIDETFDDKVNRVSTKGITCEKDKMLINSDTHCFYTKSGSLELKHPSTLRISDGKVSRFIHIECKK